MKIFAIGMNYALHNKELHGTLLKIKFSAIQTWSPIFTVL